MQATSNDKSVDLGLLRRVITPNEHCSSVQIPKEWFGRMVEVILFPVPSNAETAPQPNPIPFRANRSRLESMRVSSTPGLLSDDLIRADRDAR